MRLGLVEVVSADGDITASNSNGGITVNDCKGNMTLETSDGGIRVGRIELGPRGSWGGGY